MELLLCLFCLGLYGGVLDVELINYAGTLFVCLGSSALRLGHLVDVTGQRSQHAHGPGAVHLQFVELPGQHAHVAQRVHVLQPLDERLVHVRLYKLGEVLHLHSRHFREASWVLVHLCHQLRHDCAGRRHLLIVLVQCCCEAHYLCLAHVRLLTYARELRRKLHDSLRLCRAALHKFVQCRARGQHSPAQSLGLILAEGNGQFADRVHGSLAQVIAQGHADFIGAIDELFHQLRLRNAQAPGSSGQLVQFFAGRAGVHLLEVLIHALHLLGCLSGVLSDVGHLLLHVGVGRHGLTDGERKSGKGT